MVDWDGVPEIEIKNDFDFYRFGKLYEEYCGGQLVYCSVCDKEFIRKGSNNKLCDEHALEMERKRKR